jgi:oxygen-independent coproporphyrinogen-3 oxidase
VDSEITLEVNPDDVTDEELTAWGDAGVNRVSVGVQSFHEKEVAFLGRRHTAARAVEALEAIRRAGFARMGIDLMYGLPGQTLDDWMHSLRKALELRPEHVSCYQLSVEGGTPFGRLMENGLLELPDEEVGRNFFLETSRFLRSAGYVHYEISNFAKSSSHVARHNSKYWNHVDYLGLGPGAHSFQKGRRWWNVKSVEGYCAALRNGQSAVEGEEHLTDDQLLLERLYFGFRTLRGLDLDDVECDARSHAVVDQLTRSGLLRRENGRLIPTLDGYLVADSLPLLLME